LVLLQFVIQAMCLEPHEELRIAWEALTEARFPPRATKLFFDVQFVGYTNVTGGLSEQIRSGDPLMIQKRKRGHAGEFPAELHPGGRTGPGRRMTMKNGNGINGSGLIFWLAIAFFGAFFIYPVLRTVGEAFFVDGGFTMRYVMDVLNDATYLEGLSNALLLGVSSTIVAVIIALPLAILADRYRFPGKVILTSLLLVPLVLPPFVGAIGIKQILGQSGALNSFLSLFGLVDMEHPIDWLGQWRFGGMVLMTALHLYPIIYLNVAAALANLDPALEEAAENLGCPPSKGFFFITLPMALPGLFAGCTVAFIWGFTELGVPLIFDFTRITSVQIFDGIKDLGKSPFPYALVAVVLSVTTTLFFVSKRLIGNTDLSTSGRASVGRREARPLQGIAMRGCVALFAIVIFMALIPHLGVTLVAFSGDWYLNVLPSSLTLKHFEEALGHPLTLPAIANSLKYRGARDGSQCHPRGGHRLHHCALKGQRTRMARPALHDATGRPRFGPRVRVPGDHP